MDCLNEPYVCDDHEAINSYLWFAVFLQPADDTT